MKETRDILNHMTFPPGKVGQTKWAGLLFSEFVGVPTSGVSLKRSLAEKIMSLPEAIDTTVQISTKKNSCWVFQTMRPVSLDSRQTRLSCAAPRPLVWKSTTMSSQVLCTEFTAQTNMPQCRNGGVGICAGRESR